MSYRLSDVIRIGPGSDLCLSMMCRHGLITGSTGSGKTTTMQVMAEGLSRAGVPVLVPDMKGDMAGIARCGLPVAAWDPRGKRGENFRTTPEALGVPLMSRVLELSSVQESVLQSVFQCALESGVRLDSLWKLGQVVTGMLPLLPAISLRYGTVSSSTLAVIKRQVMALAAAGVADVMNGPRLDVRDLMLLGRDGQGWVNLLVADGLPGRAYGVLMGWLLGELFRVMPEVGKVERPRLVVFFDEAHLLFNDAPRSIVQEIERAVALIRSKGVGVWFVSQSPSDVPDVVLAQLGNRVQHALRAYTPRDMRAVKTAADTLRPNPGFRTMDVIANLRTGEALVSALDAHGVPGVVQRVAVDAPDVALRPLTPREYREIGNPHAGKYAEVAAKTRVRDPWMARNWRWMLGGWVAIALILMLLGHG